MTTIEKLKKGELFKLKNKKSVLMFEGYDRSSRKYSFSYWEDISKWGERKKGTEVMTEDEFDF